ncbi:MAG TPA: sigma-54 dependent transcriptional regulator [Syntrophobacteraceae bacterium]|nr:sigma-54 dependent transcriptional regulator [Syntrophobacteraceae bacterium]
MARVLFVEYDRAWQEVACEGLTSHRLESCPSLNEAYKRLEKETFDAIVVSIESNYENNIRTLKDRLPPHTPVVVVSEQTKTDTVVQAIRAGAFDFIVKPYTSARIRIAIEQAVENRALRNEIDYLRRTQDTDYDFNRIIAVSPAMSKVISTLRRIADSEATILITGETGTGKSMLSGTVHFNSRRRAKPFIKINCANIPETLLESELFGHERGAFTGATKTRTGRLEQANGGTVFLDEIGELTATLQAKLLRVLEEKCFERLGGNQTIRTDIRIIAATNRNLEANVQAGAFREDLYYRINVLRVHLPPLRERPECVEPLSSYLLHKICRELKRDFIGFAPGVVELFKRHHWPGNVRELSNAIERAVLLEESSQITLENISLAGFSPRSESSSKPLKDLEESEKDLLIEALEISQWVQKDAASRLGVTARKLNYMIKKHGITHTRWRRNR